MCGIFGFITDKPSEENFLMFRRVMLESAERGKDATGMAIVVGNDVVIEKAPIEAEKFVKEVDKYKEQISKANIVIGHTRKWTTGKPENNKNNHPIYSKNWVMIHNGTCTSIDKIKDYKYVGDVDSELYLANIETKGLEEGLPTISYNSAAIALINKTNPQLLHLFRHNQMAYMALDEGSKTFFFGSTDDILEYGLANRLLFFSSFKIKKIPEDVLITLGHNPLTLGAKKITVSNTRSWSGYGYGGYCGEYSGHYTGMEGSGYTKVVNGKRTRIIYKNGVKHEYEVDATGATGKEITEEKTNDDEWDATSGEKYVDYLSRKEKEKADALKEKEGQKTTENPTIPKDNLVWDQDAKWWVLGERKGKKFTRIEKITRRVERNISVAAFVDEKGNIVGYDLAPDAVKLLEHIA